MKTKKTSSGTTLRFVTVILAGLFTTQFLIAQAWFNPSWQYRAPLTITNNLTSALTNYQVQITLSSSGPWSSTFADGSDIRFTASDGTTEIPYWIESWTYGTSAVIWVKIPVINASPATTTIYLYYGAQSLSSPEPVATPPSGPFTKDSRNPGILLGSGAPGETANLLPENIVYDPITQHYWMVLSDQSSGSSIGLIYSDDPTNPDGWYWSGYPITGNPSAIAPHLIEYNGTWYIFYGDRAHGSPYPISVATSSNVSGPYTYQGQVLTVSGYPWDAARVDEPYVFQRADGKWILIYMGDAGSNVEQIGYAYADNILGPYTRFDNGDPTKPGLCIPFGSPGSYDAGTVADPWVYEYNGIYYIGYTVSSTTSSPWQTALATTTDWLTFAKQGVILPTGSEFNSFRGAVTRIGDEYVFSYTGGPASNQYRLCIATQPVFVIPSSSSGGSSNADAVFDFYDGFDGTSLDLTKWTFASSAGVTTVGSGSLSMVAASGFIKIDGRTQFGPDYIIETRAQHPDRGTSNLIMEVGFCAGTNWNNVIRIVDDFPSTTNWERQNSSGGATAGVLNMNQLSDINWHIFRLYRTGSGTAGFQIDNTPVETVNQYVPTVALPPFLMSYTNSATLNHFIVDWTRVRKWTSATLTISVGTGVYNGSQWTGAVSTDWFNSGNWTGGVPGSSTNVDIPNVTNQPVINAPAYCNGIILNSGTTIGIAGTNTLTVSGNWMNNGGAVTAGTGTVTFNGSTQTIGGSASTTFNNLTINSSVSTTLGVNINVAGDLSVTTGVFDIGSFTCNRSTAGGLLTLSNNATLKIGGTNTLPSNYSTHSIGATSIIHYSGTDQTVAALNSSQTYGNLMLSGVGTKLFPEARTITNNLTIKNQQWHHWQILQYLQPKL